MTEPVTCERCGAVADVDWIDVRRLGEPGPVFIMGRSACTTPGCVDEDGSRAVMEPDRSGQLTRQDRLWLRRQRRLIDEFGRVSQLLAEVADD